MGVNLDEWIETVKQCKYLPENDLKRLCELVIEILVEESNVQPVSSPVTVCFPHNSNRLHTSMGCFQWNHSSFVT